MVNRIQKQMTVLIVGDDAGLPRDVMNRWQTELVAPAFTLVSSTVGQMADGHFDLAVVGPLPCGPVGTVLRNLEASSSVPVLCVAAESGIIQMVRETFPRVLLIRRHEDLLRRPYFWEWNYSAASGSPGPGAGGGASGNFLPPLCHAGALCAGDAP